MVKETDLTEKLGLDENETLNGLYPDKEGGYYAVTEKKDADSIDPCVYKLDFEFNTIYTADDINDIGLLSGCYTAANGDLILSGQEGSGSDLMLVKEISSQDGSTVGRYELPDTEVIYGMTEGYDVVYADSQAVYGYKFVNKESTRIIDFSDKFDENFAHAEAFSQGNTIFMNTLQLKNSGGPSVYIMDAEGNVIKEINTDDKKSTEGCIEKVYISRTGMLYALENKPGLCKEEDTGDCITHNEYSVNIYDENGEFSKTIQLNDAGIEPSDSIQNIKVKDDGTMMICALKYNDQSKIILSVVDSDGKLMSPIDTGDIENISDIISANDTDYVIWSDGHTQISPVDYKNNKLLNAIEYDTSEIGSDPFLFEGSGSYDFYFISDAAVYGYSVKDNRNTQIMNLMNSDISLSMQSLYSVDDNTAVCCAYDSKDGKTNVYILGRADEDTIKKIQGKQIITVAGIDLANGMFGDIINDFNSSDQNYRIQLKDYSEFSTYENHSYESGAKKLNYDIKAGNVPDIIIGDFQTDMESYASKGLFTDLHTFINSDSKIKEEDYFSNIFDMYSYDGKLYQLVPQFRLDTMIGKASELGDEPGWTIDEFLKFSESRSDQHIFYNVSCDDLLVCLIKRNLSEFVDYKNKKCDFDNERFIGLLEYIRKDGIKDDDEMTKNDDDQDKMEQEMSSRFTKNRCFAELMSLYGFEDYNYMQMSTIKEAAVLKGIPMSDSNGALIEPQMTIGIAEKAQNKEAAWSFVRKVLLDEYQDGIIKDYGNILPVKKSAMQNLIKQEQSVGESDSYIEGPDGEEIQIRPIDSESAQKIVDIISAAKRHTVSDTRINGIIDEQFMLFLEDDITAEEAAKVIQNKSSLYLKEIS